MLNLPVAKISTCTVYCAPEIHVPKFLKIRNGYTNIAAKMQRKLAQTLLIKIKTSEGREQ